MKPQKILFAIGLLLAGSLIGASGQTSLLPFRGSATSDTALFVVTNQGQGAAIVGENTNGTQGTVGGDYGLRGVTSKTAGASAGVQGQGGPESGQKPGLVAGVWGDAGAGFGVIGTSKNIGVFGLSESGVSVEGFSESGISLRAITRSGNFFEAISIDAQNRGDRRFYISNQGEVFADGTFHSNGADLADFFATNESLSPGDVLVIYPDGTLGKSTRAYQTSVVGVYSAHPAYTGDAAQEMNQAGNNKIPLALAGVVLVKASSENGAILPGDLLVASSKAGHAMRAGENVPQGSVIGKALQSMKSDVAEETI